MRARAAITDGNGHYAIEDFDVGEPGPGEIRIRHKAVGLNFLAMAALAALVIEWVASRSAGVGAVRPRVVPD